MRTQVLNTANLGDALHSGVFACTRYRKKTTHGYVSFLVSIKQQSASGVQKPGTFLLCVCLRSVSVCTDALTPSTVQLLLVIFAPTCARFVCRVYPCPCRAVPCCRGSDSLKAIFRRFPERVRLELDVVSQKFEVFPNKQERLLPSSF